MCSGLPGWLRTEMWNLKNLKKNIKKCGTIWECYISKDGQRCPCLHSPKLWLCGITRQRGINVADGMKIADQLTLKKEIIHVTQQITGVGWLSQMRRSEGGSVGTQSAIATFEDGGREPFTKECWQPLEAGKGKEMGFPAELCKKESLLSTPWFEHSETHDRLLTTVLGSNNHVVVTHWVCAKVVFFGLQVATSVSAFQDLQVHHLCLCLQDAIGSFLCLLSLCALFFTIIRYWIGTQTGISRMISHAKLPRKKKMILYFFYSKF